MALTGVVVNDSLVLIDAANQYRKGYSAGQAIRMVIRRLRPILLTSLTTFRLGSYDCRDFSKPDSDPSIISLGFGVLFATNYLLGASIVHVG